MYFGLQAAPQEKKMSTSEISGWRDQLIYYYYYYYYYYYDRKSTYIVTLKRVCAAIVAVEEL
jgi:hypothetical protein